MEQVQYAYSDSWRTRYEATAGLGEVADRATFFAKEVVSAAWEQALSTICGPRENIYTTGLPTRTFH